MEKHLLFTSHYKDWLTKKIKTKSNKLIILNFMGVLIHIFDACLFTPYLHSLLKTTFQKDPIQILTNFQR